MWYRGGIAKNASFDWKSTKPLKYGKSSLNSYTVFADLTSSLNQYVESVILQGLNQYCITHLESSLKSWHVWPKLWKSCRTFKRRPEYAKKIGFVSKRSAKCRKNPSGTRKTLKSLITFKFLPFGFIEGSCITFRWVKKISNTARN